MAAPVVFHIDAERGFSGGEVQVFLLLEGLRARGWSPVLACPPGSAAAARAEELGLPVAPVRMRTDLDLPAIGKLRRAMRRSGARLVHMHTGRATWLGGLAARPLGLPTVSTRRMDRPVRRNLRNRLIYGRLVDRAVGIAPAVSRLLRDGGVADEKILTIWSSVDPTRIGATCDRDDARAALGAQPTDTLLVTTATLVHRKGIDVLLHAMTRLDASVRLAVAGDGPEREALVAEAQKLGLDARVAWLGRRDTVGDLLHAADIAVLPSRAEGLGIAALEAMAAGRPVVASRVGGLAEAVVDGGTGLLVEADEPEALAHALSRLATDRTLAARLGGAGRARVEAEFLPARMVDGYDRLYRQLLGGGP
jgi:glycosyltransferase involved in cell wall biosynthesis